jgi:hypothetical protein
MAVNNQNVKITLQPLFHSPPVTTNTENRKKRVSTNDIFF